MADDAKKIIIREPVVTTAIVREERHVIRSQLISAGIGDMTKLVYDPRGVESDAFRLDNHIGVFDAGEF